MNIPFGLADFTIGEGANAIKFDGKENFQAEGGSVNIEPVMAELKVADFGDSVWDEAINGYTAEVTIVGAKRDLETFKQALMWAETIVDSGTSEVTGITDAKLGTRMRTKAVPLKIHPREMGTDDSVDINLYKVASSGSFEQTFANEQGNVSMTFKMYPRDGADASQGGNFFYIGGTDPNA